MLEALEFRLAVEFQLSTRRRDVPVCCSSLDSQVAVAARKKLGGEV